MYKIRKFPIKLDLPEGKIEAEIELRIGAERLVVLAFKMLEISSVVVDMGIRAAQKLGFEVSCKKGCGVCCCQLVPLSPPEAAMIFELVESMPEPQKNEVKHRFSMALQSLKKTGLLKKLENLQNPLIEDNEQNETTKEYFAQQIPCPFLINQCCTIHQVRPSICREYVVTSSAENCKNPYDGGIIKLPISIRLSESLTLTWASLTKKQFKLIPLIFALEWTKENERNRFIGADSSYLLTTLLNHISNIANKRAQQVIKKLK